MSRGDHHSDHEAGQLALFGVAINCDFGLRVGRGRLITRPAPAGGKCECVLCRHLPLIISMPFPMHQIFIPLLRDAAPNSKSGLKQLLLLDWDLPPAG